MTTKPTHLAAALRSALAELDLTQQKFANDAGISVPLITKILRGDVVHRKSLKQMLRYFRDDLDAPEPKRHAIATRLVTGYLRDAFAELGLTEDEEQEIGLTPDLISARDRAILSIFRPIHDGTTLLALSCLGNASAENVPLRDTVYSLADMSNSLQPRGLPPHHFRQSVEKPVQKSKPTGGGPSFGQFVGGSLGMIITALSSED
jgi:transcriptional regulator with XRE-family HTH domain